MQFVLLIAALAALTWGIVLALRGSLLTGCLVYLVLVCCCGQHLTEFVAGPIHVSLDRIFLLGLVGASVAQRWAGVTESRPIGRSELALGGFFAVLLWGTFSHDWQTASRSVSPVLPHLVNGYLIPLVLLWIARQSALTEREVRRVQTVLVGFGIYLAVTAMLEVAGAWSLVLPRYIADPQLGIHFGRARGPMLQSGTFGMYLVICVAALWISLVWQPRFGRTGRLVALALLPLFGAAIYATMTRSAWMGAGLTAALLVALTFRGGWRPVVLIGMLMAGLAIVAVKGDQLVAFKRDALSVAQTRESTYMRAKFAYVSWAMFRDRPLRGHGFGQFPLKNRAYLSDRSTPMRLETIRGYINHNTFLSVLVDLGLIGLVLFLAVLASWIRAAWRLWKASDAPDWARAHGLLMLAALVPYFCQMMFREVSYSPMENAPLFLLAGVTLGLRQVVLQPQAATDHPPVGYQPPETTLVPG